MFLLPWLAGFFLLTLGPTLASLVLSFTNFDLIQAPRWVGTANYERIATADAKFWRSMSVTFLYVIMSVPLKLAFALGVAMMLNRGIRGLPLYRALFYLPSLLGASVAIAVLWRKLFAGDGLLNQFLAMFGIQGPSWVSNPDYALYTLVVLSIWQFGSPMIIFLAGLRQIPQDMYEAASLDGASPFRQFVKITLPLLTPVIFFNLVTGLIAAFQIFENAYIMTGGGPNYATYFFGLNIYFTAFRSLRFGYASTIAYILFILIAALTLFVMSTSRRWVYYAGEKD